MPGAIVFDLDGTLVDSAPDLCAALNKVLAEEGAAEVSLSQTRGLIGHGIPSLVQKAAELRGLDVSRLGPMTRSMLQHYLRAPCELTRPYPGVEACLTDLKTAGYSLGLCTNKAETPTLMILDQLNLRLFFTSIIGGDSIPERKPDPAPLAAAFRSLGTPLLYVGDSEVDEATAQACGVPFALHAHGYRKQPVEAFSAVLTFDDFRNLTSHILSA